jgi:hypothetical protein
VKYPLRAAVAAAVVTLASGALMASGNPQMMAFDYDGSTNVVSGVSTSWLVTKLRHVPGTGNLFVDNPDIIPAGSCRSVAIRWNLYVFQNKSRSHFLRLIKTSAEQNCSFEFTAGAPDGTGVQPALTIRPAASL